MTTVAPDALVQLCHDLRLLREQAGGPSVRTLAVEVGLGKSQVDAILNGRIRRPPEWSVVRGLVEAFYRCARDRGRLDRLSIRAGLDEYWRPRYTLVEHACSQPVRRTETVVVDPGSVVPRQLPPAPPHFVGRADELAILVRAAAAGAPLLVTGMAGVGKTALALAFAHRVAREYPDGQLYVNLRGFDPSRTAMTPAEAVRGLLEALGVAPQAFPPGFEAQVGLYRSLLSERHMLVLLDDAGDADQVRAVLPGAPGCRVLVTSRVELTGLVAADGAYPLALTVLPDLDARQMLVQRLGSDRVAAEPEAVRTLVAACGRLPIALTVVAARAATRPAFPLSAIAEESAGALHGDVGAVFSWSYRALSEPAARLFRLLGLHCGPDLGAGAAASLAGGPDAEVAPLLAELTQAHLVTEPAPGRYSFHDLLRAYAIDRAEATETAAERTAARRRYLDHYVRTAWRAALLLSPHRPRIADELAGAGHPAEPLDDREAALAWFATEQAVLLAAAEQAYAIGCDEHVWRLGWALSDFLELSGRLDDWIAVQNNAVAAARRVGELEIVARMLLILGNAYGRTAHYDDAGPPFHEALALFRRIGNPTWEARTVNALGGLMERQGKYAEALEYAERSLAIYRDIGDRAGVARVHNAIGWCHSHLGDDQLAIEHCRQSMEYYLEVDDRSGQAAAWDSLGHAYQGLGQYGESVRCYERALGLLREAHDRYNEAGTLERLGGTYAAAGDVATAREVWRQAIARYEELDLWDAAVELRARARLDA